MTTHQQPRPTRGFLFSPSRLVPSLVCRFSPPVVAYNARPLAPLTPEFAGFFMSEQIMKLLPIAIATVATLLFSMLCVTCASAQDIAQGKPVRASSTYVGAAFAPSNANDGQSATRYASAYAPTFWIEFDLVKPTMLASIRIDWELACAEDFSIEGSLDAVKWTGLQSTMGNTALSNIILLTGTARYVRIVGTKRCLPSYGYSIYSVSISGSTVVPWTKPTYQCDFKKDGELRAAKDQQDSNVGVALWYCDTPKVIQWQTYCGDPDKLPSGFFTLSYAKAMALIKGNVQRPCTAAELHLRDLLHAAEGVRITVSGSGAAADKTRPIYSKTADNKLGPLVPSKRAAVDAPCQFNRLQNADGTGSMYFEVLGGYTLCKITGAVSK